jgi:hypothetical protein
MAIINQGSEDLVDLLEKSRRALFKHLLEANGASTSRQGLWALTAKGHWEWPL